MKYVIARSQAKRPTLQHGVSSYRSEVTLCGYEITGWSRSFSDAPIPAVLCMKCKKIIGEPVVKKVPAKKRGNVVPMRRKRKTA